MPPKKASAVDPLVIQKINLNVRIEDVNLSPAEVGASLEVWSSVWRTDAGPGSIVKVEMPLDAARNSGVFTIALVLPANVGSAADPWPADATVWFGAHTWAASEEGPLVGGRAGEGGVRFTDLHDRLVGKHDILLRMLMSQPGIPGPEGRYCKMLLRIIGFADTASAKAAASWACARTTTKYDFTEANMAAHDAALDEYVGTSLFPYTDAAKRQALLFQPAHHEVEPIHAPYWQGNVVAPGFAFWMQMGAPKYDAAMTEFMEEAAATILARHDWPKSIPGANPALTAADAFVDVCDKQFAQDEVYSDTFTYAAAVLSDVCTLLSVSTFYRYDEVYRVAQEWNGQRSEQKAMTESFQDALTMCGGDCEDTAQLASRVWQWLQMGDPAFRARSKYWRQLGGWGTPVLDRLQRIAYWYVNAGVLGSVTAARYVPAKGEVPQLIVGSPEDERLPIGGHMWQEAMPVTKFEELVDRMSSSGKSSKSEDTSLQGGMVARPAYIKQYPLGYPKWVKFLPHTVGEGTGSVYPLALPLVSYMHSATGRASAGIKHRKMLNAILKVQNKTKTISRYQIQRWSETDVPVPDARVNTFYRRAVKLSTAELGPNFDFTWTRIGERERASGDEERILSKRGSDTGRGIFAGANGNGSGSGSDDSDSSADSNGSYDSDDSDSSDDSNDNGVNSDSDAVNYGSGANFYSRSAIANMPALELIGAPPVVEFLPNFNEDDFTPGGRQKLRQLAKENQSRADDAAKLAKRARKRADAAASASASESEAEAEAEAKSVKKAEKKAKKKAKRAKSSSAAPSPAPVAKKEKKPKKAKTPTSSTKKASASSAKRAKKAKSADKKRKIKAPKVKKTKAPKVKKTKAPKVKKPKVRKFKKSRNAIGGAFYNSDSDSDSNSDSDASFDSDPYSSAFIGNNARIGVPGENTFERAIVPKYGVDMVDRLMTCNRAINGGKAHRGVALTAVPPVTREQMKFFGARVAHLPPWRQPWRSLKDRKALDAVFAEQIETFQASAEQALKEGRAAAEGILVPADGGETRINVIFRREQFFQEPPRSVIPGVLADIHKLAKAGDISRVETAFEFLEKEIYNVRVSLWFVEQGFTPY